MKAKKILLISHEMSYTGAPHSLLGMARILRQTGYSVTVCTLAFGKFVVEFLKYGFFVTAFDRNSSDATCQKLASEYDLAICNTVFCAEVAYKLQQHMKTILFIREAQNLPDILLGCHIDEGYLRNAEYMVCVSEYAEKFILRHYHPKRLWVLHNFLMAPPSYRPGANKVRGGKVHFLIAATLEWRKGMDVAIQAVRLLPKAVSCQLVLDIAGRRPEWARQFWENLIPSGDSRFVYHGEVTFGKRRLFQRANVVLVPSRDESCSLTALEGGMFGKPLIVTENVGAKYMAEGSGFVVKTGSAEELAWAMKFFIENKDELDLAGKICFRRFCETSTKDIYHKNLAGILSEVFGE